MPTLRSGDLAFWDSFSGMVPCRVLSISGQSGNPSTAQLVRFKLTAARGPYRRGEEHEAHGLRVCARDAVKFRQYGTYVYPYTVECDAGTAPAKPESFNLARF